MKTTVMTMAFLLIAVLTCSIVVGRPYVFFTASRTLYNGMYRWLDSGRDDGLIERELEVVDYVKTPPPQEPLKDEAGLFSSCGLL